MRGSWHLCPQVTAPLENRDRQHVEPADAAAVLSPALACFLAPPLALLPGGGNVRMISPAKALRKYRIYRAKQFLRKTPDLWNELHLYLQRTESTGCSYVDYAELYRLIRKNKPTEILECGTGVSTLVIARALMENEEKTGVRGRVTSMEEHSRWLQMSRDLLPIRYAPYVEFVLSDTMEDRYSLFRGMRYASLPERGYDFVFVDGPSYVSPSDGGATFDFDFLHVLRGSKSLVSALVDKRVSTVFVLQQLLGTRKVYYSSINGLGYVAPSSMKDLGNIATSISSKDFSGSFSWPGNSRLCITAKRGQRA